MKALHQRVVQRIAGNHLPGQYLNIALCIIYFHCQNLIMQLINSYMGYLHVVQIFTNFTNGSTSRENLY